MIRRLVLTSTVVAGLAVFAGYGSASTRGRWVMTDIGRAAHLAFPDYAGRYLLEMTPGGRILWTARKVGGTRAVLEVFQWQDGQISDLGPLPEHGGLSGWNSGGAGVGTIADPPYCPHVVINPTPCTPGPTHAYLWQPGKTTLLGTLGGKSAQAWAINDRGQVVGWSETARGVRHAFLWQNGKMIDISPRGTLWGNGELINDHGQVLEYVSGKKTWRYSLWQRGRLTPLPARLQPVVMNELGQAVGLNQRSHVVLWENGRTTDLGYSEDPYESAISDRGDVMISRVRGSTHRGVLWRNGKLTDLGDLGGGWTFPAAMNDRDQIVGTSTLPGSKPEDFHAAAFIWQDGKMTRLPGSPDFLGATVDIDASGTHVVFGWPANTCTAKSCTGQLVLWTWVP